MITLNTLKRFRWLSLPTCLVFIPTLRSRKIKTKPIYCLIQSYWRSRAAVVETRKKKKRKKKKKGKKKRPVFLEVSINKKAKESEHRVYGKHCSYRYSVLFESIPLLMSSIESYLSNKPKQCILKYLKLKFSRLCHYTIVVVIIVKMFYFKVLRCFIVSLY